MMPPKEEDWWTRGIEAYRRAVLEEFARCNTRSVSDLIADIKAGQFGRHYQIWRSLGARASLEEVGWVLYDVLNSDIDSIERYHCANALFSIGRLHEEGFGNYLEFWDKRNYPVDENLAELRQVLERKLGPRPT